MSGLVNLTLNLSNESPTQPLKALVLAPTDANPNSTGDQASTTLWVDSTDDNNLMIGDLRQAPRYRITEIFASATPQFIALTQNVPVALSLTTGWTNGGSFSNLGASTMTYTGTLTKYALVQASITGLLSAGTNCNIRLRILQGGGNGTAPVIQNFPDTTAYTTISTQQLCILAPNDVLSCQITNLTDNNDIVIQDFYMVVSFLG
jgi:hypothetical protein